MEPFEYKQGQNSCIKEYFQPTQVLVSAPDPGQSQFMIKTILVLIIAIRRHTQRNGPNLGAKTDRLNFQSGFGSNTKTSSFEFKLTVVVVFGLLEP